MHQKRNNNNVVTPIEFGWLVSTSEKVQAMEGNTHLVFFVLICGEVLLLPDGLDCIPVIFGDKKINLLWSVFVQQYNLKKKEEKNNMMLNSSYKYPHYMSKK